MKKQKIKEIWANINIIRSIPAILTYFFIKKDKVSKDIENFMKGMSIKSYSNWSTIRCLNYLFVWCKEFRNVYYYRLKRQNLILSILIKIFYRPVKDLYINTDDIGSGLTIYHGFSTIIYAKSIGKNCSIWQQVTIGKTNDIPTIGDNVSIAAGAIVIGGINIGNNSVIGAGAVVTKDVPNNCVVAGNPARIIRRNGVKVDEQLELRA